MKSYFSKMRGCSTRPPASRPVEVLLGFVGSCVALYVVGVLHALSMNTSGFPLIMAPFGASAVLVFGAFRSPLAQPRNVIGGHVLSAIVGVTVYQLVGDNPVVAVSLSVSAAIALMHITQTLHPPGGATAFVTAAGGPAVHALGYWYVLTPCAIGSGIMVLVALIVNNVPKEHKYPQFWV
ncbi:HPP family protein [Desulfosarcina sp. OttesenSCG-928-A07]|nr:HPP family protein [Desulfosarcina sp. OttesenSCG-928-A07]